MMLTAGANKAAKPTGRCHRCGLRGGACRPVRFGYWCQVEGLEEDTSTWIIPSPDPVSVAVHADPKVVEALGVLEARQAEADAAHGEWLKALKASATDEVVNGSGLFQSIRKGRKAEALAARELEARLAMDHTFTLLAQARTAHEKAVDDARRREVAKDRQRSGGRV